MIYLVQQYFDSIAKRNPKKTAVVFNDETISYKELGEYSNQLARTLKKEGVARGDRVCFCLFKSINSIKAILGILKADAVYVPLDAFSPAARLRKIIQDAEPRVLIYDTDTASLAKTLAPKSATLLRLGERHIEEDIRFQKKTNLAYANTTEDLAYIFYTSGSTGTPKGVMITHRNLTGCAEWAVGEFGITSKDVLSSHPPFHFDLSTFDIYACFKAGATLAVVPERLSVFPGALLDYIEKHKMTIWNSVPSLLSYLARSGALTKNRIRTVKKVFFNGEVFPLKYLAQWMRTFPKKEFVNMYGPTEATVQCSFYRIKKIPKNLKKPVPIGKACSNAEIFAVTAEGKRAVTGERGELYIRGSCVARGYWRNKNKTAEAFVRDPFRASSKELVYKTGDLVFLNKDGDYKFLGRIDHQIKHMGYRIELGEVEAALFSLPYVKEAVVVAYERDDDRELCAFVVAGNRGVEKIRSDLKKIVPQYMVPARVRTLAKLPKTSTGKIDRVSLKKKYAAKK